MMFLLAPAHGIESKICRKMVKIPGQLCKQTRQHMAGMKAMFGKQRSRPFHILAQDNVDREGL
jgi:hypothetical protein